ncbi:MAG: amidohydrolase [Chitinophagaceae bacterium]|nr:amidohydrolase [Chitinophagaceae bacterium]
MIDEIKLLAKEFKNDLVKFRRYLHEYPELSFREFETSKYIQQQLKDIGIEYTVMATTGVVAIIKGKNPASRVIALRADMDALPITEQNEVDYKSKNIGVMHACGHDVHSACLLGAAKILQHTKDKWDGTVKCIFQPGEEKNPGGASIMIKEGVLENPAPQKIFAMHVHTVIEAGEFSFRGGIVMASADEIYITLKGRGGHAASPQLTADPIFIAAHIVTGLQQIISRNNNPFNPSVLSITSFQGGTTTNVIPSEVKLMGTFRAMNEEWRFAAHNIIKKYVVETAASMGAVADITIDVGYPAVFNDEMLSQKAREQAELFAGKEKVFETELRMGAEDFAFYAQKIPACFFRIGTANKSKGITSGVHTPTFNVDEAAIEHGIGMMAWLAVSC